MVFEGKSRMEAYEKLSKEFGLSVGGVRHAIVAAIASEVIENPGASPNP